MKIGTGELLAPTRRSNWRLIGSYLMKGGPYIIDGGDG